MNRNLNTNITQVNFKNNHIVYESITKCVVKDYEYNLSFNPTLLSGSQGLLIPYSSSNGGDIFYINAESNYGILKPFAQGQGSKNYSYNVSLGETITPGGTNIGLYGDDVVSSLIPIGFDFEFYNNVFNGVYLSSNGNLQFNSYGAAYNSNDSIPAPYSTLKSTIFPFWSDLILTRSTRADAGIYTQTIGSPGSRIFTAEWRSNFYGLTYEANFQVRLYEGTNNIEFVYGKIDKGNSFAIGLQKDYNDNINYNQYAQDPFTPSIGTKITYFPAYKDLEFSPYVGTIGLYNDAGDLLAIAKMAAPIPLSANTDTTFLIKYDTQWLPKPYFTPTPSPTVTPFSTPSTTPTNSPTPSPTPSPINCVAGGPAVAVFVPSPSPTPTVTPSVTPTIPVTPSATPTPTPSTSIGSTPPASTVTLTFYSYESGAATFTLSSPISTNLNISGASVSGFANSSCLRAALASDSISSCVLLANTTSQTASGFVSLSNNSFITYYKKANSINVNGNVVSNGSIINVNGVNITIIISTACNTYIP